MLHTVSPPPSEARSPPPARRYNQKSSYTSSLTVTLGDSQLQFGPCSLKLYPSLFFSGRVTAQTRLKAAVVNIVEISTEIVP
jgi:hypothetical protein